ALLLLVFPLAVLLAACGDDDNGAVASEGNGSGATTTTEAASSGSSAQGAADVQVVETDLGEVVADADGMILYAFTPDSATKSTCNDACADTWPPAEADGEPTADGIDASK